MGCTCGSGETVIEGDVQDKPVEPDWTRLGGGALEEPLQNGWVALVRADWLVKLAESGGVLKRRQDLPAEAFVSLEELKEAGAGVLSGSGLFGVDGEWLRIVVLSYPWLQPAHPDPHGENLRLIAKVLSLYVQDSWGYVNSGKPYGVLIDFTALPQAPRSDEDQQVFKLALPALNLFYSHPNTIVLKVTTFPEGYPNNPKFEYKLPAGANTVAYEGRGWCYAESAMSGLVKDSNKVLDLGKLNFDRGFQLGWQIHESKSGRAPPLHPGDFKVELDKKTFTCKKDDFNRVAKLYADAHQRHLESAKELVFAGLEWDADTAQKLLKALKNNKNLCLLDLAKNKLGVVGAAALGSAVKEDLTGLQSLNLESNKLEAQGAAALVQALEGNAILQSLNLRANDIGAEGMAALAKGLKGTALQSLNLGVNYIGPGGGLVLEQVLKENKSLQSIDLWSNMLGDEGAAALGRALKENRTLQSLDLGYNSIKAEGAVALAQALKENRGLQWLGMQRNSRLGNDGMAALKRVADWSAWQRGVKLDVVFF